MSSVFSTFSPLDGQLVWEGASTDSEAIDVVMADAATASSWRLVPVDERIAIVRRYAEVLRADRNEIADLISREVGKLPWDADGEVSAAIAKVELSIQAMQQRRSEVVLDSPDGRMTRRIQFRPIGVALVLGPFNFPLHLPGGQIIPALLAGNTVVFKPSDKATAVGQWMLAAWGRAGLPKHALQMIVGGTETAKHAIDSPHLGGVFLTGSRAAGRAIHRQLAGRPGVLLALELGGHNPIVITEDLDPETVARIVSFSAFVSAGQRCTCARRAIFINGSNTQTQIDRLLDYVQKLVVGAPVVPAPVDDIATHLGPLIDAAAAQSLRETYDSLLAVGCKPLIEFSADVDQPNLVRPAIVDATGLTSEQICEVGKLEWFGPLLVIERQNSFETAVESARATPYGLAASLLGGEQTEFDQFTVAVAAGVVNWNGPTTGAAGALPFGGLGDSGNHRPAGFYAIDFCSDPVASLERAEPMQDDPWKVADQ